MLFLGSFIISVASRLIYVSSHIEAGLSNLEAKTSATVYFEGILLGFSSSRPSFTAGERAVFYIDVLNFRDQAIHRIDFSVKVKPLYLLGFPALEIYDYSTRTFNPNRLERITIVRTLPIATPPGSFALELVAKPASTGFFPTTTIVIYVKPCEAVFVAALVTSIFLGIVYCLSAFVTHVGVDSLRSPVPGKRLKVSLRARTLVFWATVELPPLRSVTFRKLGIIMLSVDDKLRETVARARETVSGFSVGQKFVSSTIFLLVASALVTSVGRGDITDQVAILTYFAFFIGVGNIVWESLSETTRNSIRLFRKIRFPSRTILSLATFGLLAYLSCRSVWGIVVVVSVLILYTVFHLVTKKSK